MVKPSFFQQKVPRTSSVNYALISTLQQLYVFICRASCTEYDLQTAPQSASHGLVISLPPSVPFIHYSHCFSSVETQHCSSQQQNAFCLCYSLVQTEVHHVKHEPLGLKWCGGGRGWWFVWFFIIFRFWQSRQTCSQIPEAFRVSNCHKVYTTNT